MNRKRSIQELYEETDKKTTEKKPEIKDDNKMQIE